MDDGVVTDFGHVVKACALGQASSSIMASHVVGATADELRDVHETMRKMLKENGPPPTGRFEDLKYLEPVRDYRARHASTMLTFDAVVDAIGQIERNERKRPPEMRPSEALALNRDKVLEIIARYPVTNPRVFGSVARGEDVEGSDIDILVHPDAGMSYFDLARLALDLETLLGCNRSG
jgi:predicted nucleotidyltransferase